jgi:DNA-binding CsgD family transcriptional regulator/Tfp pilus assembly protein PilF
MMDYDRALGYYLQAAKLKEEHGQKRSLSNTLNNIGIIYRTQGRYDSASFFYNKSLDIAIEFEDLKKQAHAYNNLAIIYELSGQYELMDHSFQQAIDLKIQLGDKAGLLNSYQNFAKVLIKHEKIAEAGSFIKLTDQLSEEIGDNLFSSAYLITKAKYYKAIGDFNNSLEYTNQAFNKRTDEMNEDRNDRIAEWEVKYETALREIEIEHLENQKKLSEQDAKIKAQKFQWLIIFSLLSFGVLIMVFWLVSSRSKLKRELLAEEVNSLRSQIKLVMEGDLSSLNMDLDSFNAKISSPLSEREFEILQYIVSDKSNGQIAEEISLSINTVKYHLKNVYEKLGVGSRKEALQFAIQSTGN